VSVDLDAGEGCGLAAAAGLEGFELVEVPSNSSGQALRDMRRRWDFLRPGSGQAALSMRSTLEGAEGGAGGEGGFSGPAACGDGRSFLFRAGSAPATSVT